MSRFLIRKGASVASVKQRQSEDLITNDVDIGLNFHAVVKKEGLEPLIQSPQPRAPATAAAESSFHRL